MDEWAFIIPAVIALVTMAAAWGGTVAGLNGTRTQVREIAQAARDHEAKDYARHAEILDRLARIETKMEKWL